MFILYLLKSFFFNYIDFVFIVGEYSKDIYIIPYNGVVGLISYIGFLFTTNWGEQSLCSLHAEVLPLTFVVMLSLIVACDC